VEACRVKEPALAMVAKPATSAVLREDPGGPPFLTCPQRATAEGSAGRHQRSPNPQGDRAPQHVQRHKSEQRPTACCPGKPKREPKPGSNLTVAA
jgi:hypothetical protein